MNGCPVGVARLAERSQRRPGSRGVGNKIAGHHIGVAQRLAKQWWIDLPDPDLAYLVEGTAEFTRYIRELRWAQHFALLNREGSSVRLGNLTLVPVEQSIVYVRPLYVQAAGSTPVPELRYVIVAHGERIVMEESLAESLEELFGVLPETGEDPDFIEGETPEPGDDGEGDEGEAPGDDGDDGTPPSTTTPPTTTPGQADTRTAAELLADAGELFDEADAALREGDLGEYQRLVREAEQLVSRALELLTADEEPAPPPTDSA